jgi:hypothetical protein
MYYSENEQSENEQSEDEQSDSEDDQLAIAIMESLSELEFSQQMQQALMASQIDDIQDTNTTLRALGVVQYWTGLQTPHASKSLIYIDRYASLQMMLRPYIP